MKLLITVVFVKHTGNSAFTGGHFQWRMNLGQWDGECWTGTRMVSKRQSLLVWVCTWVKKETEYHQTCERTRSETQRSGDVLPRRRSRTRWRWTLTSACSDNKPRTCGDDAPAAHKHSRYSHRSVAWLNWSVTLMRTVCRSSFWSWCCYHGNNKVSVMVTSVYCCSSVRPCWSDVTLS